MTDDELRTLSIDEGLALNDENFERWFKIIKKEGIRKWKEIKEESSDE